LQAAENSSKLKGGTPTRGGTPIKSGAPVRSVQEKARDKHTDKTTRLLIGILVLFLIAELPQVGS
jgi:hypothetical protein